jgi:cytochrome c553
VGLVLVATGLMDATSAANSKTLAVQLTAQLNEALKAVQMDVAAKHEVNAAAIAINEMDIKALAAHPVLEPPIPEISLDNPPKKE